MRIASQGDANPDFGAFGINLRDGTSANRFFTIGSSDFNLINSNTTAVEMVLDSGDNTDGFHTFRLARAAGSSSIDVYRDGNALSSATAGSSALAPNFSWGDNSTTTAGAVEIDYVRFDTTGAFEPAAVPEPSSFVLLGLVGTIGLVSYGRRKSKKSA